MQGWHAGRRWRLELWSCRLGGCVLLWLSAEAAGPDVVQLAAVQAEICSASTELMTMMIMIWMHPSACVSCYEPKGNSPHAILTNWQLHIACCRRFTEA
jgi:hypothetical protein